MATPERYPGQDFFRADNDNIRRTELNWYLNREQKISETCQYSHLPIDFLKLLGKSVEKCGPGITETAIIAALKMVGVDLEGD